jgi:hypothetical protein
MSRSFKIRGGKTFKKKIKRCRRKKHITVKKMVKSRRKRNTKSRRKCNTVKKMVKSRRKYKKKAKPRRTLRARGVQKQAAGGENRPSSGTERRQRNLELSAYRWVDEDMVLKGYIKHITTDPGGGQFVIVHTQIGEGGGFDDVMFEPLKWLELEKTKMNSDETKNLKDDAARWEASHAPIRHDENWNNDGDDDSDGDTASTNDQDLSPSARAAWESEAAEAAEAPLSDNDDDNDNTASTSGFFDDLGDFSDGEDIEGQGPPPMRLLRNNSNNSIISSIDASDSPPSSPR